jgi:hypothetical protein
VFNLELLLFMSNPIRRTMSVFILDLYVDVKDLLRLFGSICRYVKFVNVNTYVSIFVIVRFFLKKIEFCVISEICYVRRLV